MQTTLLGLAIAFIFALIAALIGPYFIDWNQFRPQFEAEATRVIGAPVRVGGTLDARLLPSPSLRLRSVDVGGANDGGKVRADKLDVEFSLSSLMRGEWRATELTIDGAALDVGLDAQGRIDLPTPSRRFNLGTLAIDRLNLTGRIVLHDASSRQTLDFSDVTFSGDVRSLAGAMRGDGSFTFSGTRYPFRVSSGQTTDLSGTRLHLTIDPGERPLSIDLDGVLSFDARAPRFDGAVTLARPAAVKPKPTDDRPWRITARVKANPSTARFEQIEASYGTDDVALKLGGMADLRLGASPMLHAVMSSRTLDADRLFPKDDTNREARRLLPEFRKLVAAFPQAPMASQIEISADQITLGGRPVQTFSADVRTDATSWTINRMDFRAPGMTRINLSGDVVRANSAGTFRGAVSVDSSDPDMLAAWLAGRSDVSYRSQKPLRARGMLSVAAGHVAIDALQVDIDGSNLEGRAAYADATAASGSRLDVDVKGDRLDIDAVVALLRSLGGPQGEWPDSGQLSVDIGRAISAGQEMRPLIAQLGYGPKMITLDRFRIGDASSLMLDGGGSFDRIESTGKLIVSATSASLKQMTTQMTSFAPAAAARLNTMAATPGAVSLKLALDLDKHRDRADLASARAVFDIAAPQLDGKITLSATPALAAMRSLDLDALLRGELAVESRLSAARGSQLLALLGLDGTIATGDSPLTFEGSASGPWRAPLRIEAALSGADLGASVQGIVEPWSDQPKAALTLAINRANFAPLFELKPADGLAADISLSSRVTLADSKLSFDDIDSTVAGSRLRGRMALTLGIDKAIDGQIGLDTIALAPVFGLALGSRGRDADEPLGRGLLQGWRGQVAFQALRGLLPGGSELRPVSGTIKSDGHSFGIDGLKGTIGGGEAVLDVDAKPGVAGLAVNARVQLTNADGSALRYRSLAMPAGRSNLRMTLAAQGRSAFALEGALSGNGLLTIDTAKIAGLSPLAFDAAIRASDSGQATDDSRLRQIVEASLSTGVLSVASAQIPFSLQSGRLRVSATALEANAARAIVSGGYDLAADQADIRVNLVSTASGPTLTRPELQVFAVGSPDRLDRTVDVTALSSWLAVRAIDRETKRLDSLERGEKPSAFLPTALPPSASGPSSVLVPDVASVPPSSAPLSTDVPVFGRDPRRGPFKPTSPRSAVIQPAPQTSQQVAPLPTPIEIRPAPGARLLRPRPAPPLVITPPATGPAR